MKTGRTISGRHETQKSRPVNWPWDEKGKKRISGEEKKTQPVQQKFTTAIKSQDQTKLKQNTTERRGRILKRGRIGNPREKRGKGFLAEYVRGQIKSTG